jgi:hypothetical protein
MSSTLCCYMPRFIQANPIQYCCISSSSSSRSSRSMHRFIGPSRHSLTPCLLPRCFCCEELQCLLALCLCYSILLLYRLKHQAPLLLLHAASARQLTHSFRCLLRVRVGALVFLGLGSMLGVGLGVGLGSMRHKIAATFVLISGCDLASCNRLLVLRSGRCGIKSLPLLCSFRAAT